MCVEAWFCQIIDEILYIKQATVGYSTYCSTVLFLRGRGETGEPLEDPNELCLLLRLLSSLVITPFAVNQLESPFVVATGELGIAEH